MPIGSEVIARHIYADENGIIGSITPLRVPTIDATPFSRWKRQNAESAVTRRVHPLHARAVDMYDGNHWQGGWGWIGPKPHPQLDGPTDIQEAVTDIMNGFVSRNVVREIARRFRRAAMGREPRWALVPRDMSALKQADPDAGDDDDDETTPVEPEPTPTADPTSRARQRQQQRRRTRAKSKRAKPKIPKELQSLIDEASRAITLWWDERGVHELLQKFITTLQMPSGRAAMRIYLPDGFRTTVVGENGARTRRLAGSTSLDDALAKLYPEHPLPTQSVVYEDPQTKRKCGVTIYSVPDESNSAGRVVVELTYLDDAGAQTIVRTLTGDAEQSSSAGGVDLGGRLLMYEATMEPIITEQMIEMQRALNLALTMLPRNITTSGFLSRIITNGKLPGHWEVVDGKRTGKYIVDELPIFGPSMTNYIKGEEVKNKDGTSTLANVGVHESPPVDPTPTIHGVRGIYESMLEEGEQDHVLDRGADNANSGRSKEQGRAGFESASDEIATRVNRMGRWLLETLLACAEVLMGQPGKYTSKLRVVFECRTKVGPVSTDERASYINAYEKGVIALETAQEAIGVYDVDAERDKIEAQEGGAIDLRIRQANAFKMFIDAKLHGELAGELVGFSPDLLERIAQSFDEALEREAEQKAAELENATKIAETGAAARGVGQGVGGGRPSGNKSPPNRQGASKLTQKQSNKDRARPSTTA